MILTCTAFAADLRVCADPDNMPYSNSKGQGFENELAKLVSRELGRTLVYVWVSEWRRYFKALAADRCDVVMEVPGGFSGVQATRPYYRSTYVFVSRSDHRPRISTLDDSRLRTMRIGLQAIDAADAMPPAAAALNARGMIDRVAWFHVDGNPLASNESPALIRAVERCDVDVAIAWGPLAGYYAKQAAAPLAIVPVRPQTERVAKLAFDISMGVQEGNSKLAGQLNSIIGRRSLEIGRLLDRYGVPRAAVRR